MSDRGETLIELVVGLALLALLVTMLVTVFQTSSNSLYYNIDNKRSINTQVAQLIEEDTQVIESVKLLNIQTSYSALEVQHTENFQVEIIKPKEGSIYKFR